MAITLNKRMYNRNILLTHLTGRLHSSKFYSSKSLTTLFVKTLHRQIFAPYGIVFSIDTPFLAPQDSFRMKIMETHEVESCLRGFHVYQDIWTLTTLRRVPFMSNRRQLCIRPVRCSHQEQCKCNWTRSLEDFCWVLAFYTERKRSAKQKMS